MVAFYLVGRSSGRDLLDTPSPGYKLGHNMWACPCDRLGWTCRVSLDGSVTPLKSPHSTCYVLSSPITSSQNLLTTSERSFRAGWLKVSGTNPRRSAFAEPFRTIAGIAGCKVSGVKLAIVSQENQVEE
jgi:hypothetical protein